VIPVAFATLALAAVPAAPLDDMLVTEAIVRIRQALPGDWTVADIHRDTVPFGWVGDSTCVFLRLEDGSVQYPHPTHGFSYRPFHKVWLLPLDWEGRMEVSAIDPATPVALYLGENADLRVLHRTLGRNPWPEGPDVVAAALGLDAYPLTPQPQHTLDVDAMQVLYRRLDSRPGMLERWQRQIYGVAELPGLIYLELLTWDDRRDSQDPTFLGELAERETHYLSREVLAAFPEKHGLYLRRVTRGAFADVILTNPARHAGVP
jgi:hypothetical protein